MVAWRVAHNYFALIIPFIIMGMVHCGSHQLSEEQLAKRPTEDTENARPRTPSPQEIAASMNTHWDTWEEAEEHCKNICEASWIACRLRQCDDMPGVRRPDEL